MPVHLADIGASRDGRMVLAGLSLRLGPRERLAIVGPNGAGKTTLLRLMVGLEAATTGTVTLFGIPCRTERDFRAHRLRIGYLFQDSDDQLFCPTVVEDVAFGPLNAGAGERDAQARALETLTALGTAHLAQRITHRLSGGEKRLVALAGLLAMRPDVLLLDEPTNGVDQDNAARLLAALQAFSGAMVLVSHDDTFLARLATRTLILRDGTLCAAR
ncbi:MAG: ABC transporter ATP-binding protein [Acuticoccus sp.]